ncbi:phosphate starvation-inducible PhoH-like protein [Brevibacterium sanguinis]|uniref:PhoH-like protein n=2 Tax=Brevibacterium TaxID=1696 RepID=A0A366IJZ0_9MICO|nr:PhoH family protein [Brevibacterium celere]RBP63931.1 phosphate starvation-inducible PhoH-like protein [Brevibacterium sanguinis]RBP70794.1 phosphate starvation-inducible PhoH-like protein [Brevibacterium celere]
MSDAAPGTGAAASPHGADSDTVRLVIPDSIDLVEFFGPGESNVRQLERVFPGLDLHVRANQVQVSGHPEEVARFVALIGELKKLHGSGHRIDEETIERVSSFSAEGKAASAVLGTNILSTRGRSIRPKTMGQHDYVKAIRNHTITFGIGPAGTGKTYLAMAMAVNALQHKEVSRIILTRPAVEAGERLGFLPGTLNEKIDPYVRPLYDALHDMVDPESIPTLIETGTIEVAPLAYMRGRTLNDAFIILDEAQNTTGEQMKMFLTRLGFGSRMVVTGDVSQIDLPGSTRSGLKVVQEILDGIEDLRFCHLGSKDVVRHSLVTKIVDAYDLWGAAQ